MKYELIHDRIAQQVYDKSSADAKARRKVEQLIAGKYNFYKERGQGLLSQDDLDIIRPYVTLVNIPPEQLEYIEASQKELDRQLEQERERLEREKQLLQEQQERLKRDRRRQRWTFVILLLIGALISFLLWRTVQATREATDKTRQAEESAEIASQQEKLAQTAQEQAQQESERAEILRLRAERDSLAAAQLGALVAAKEQELNQKIAQYYLSEAEKALVRNDYRITLFLLDEAKKSSPNLPSIENNFRNLRSQIAEIAVSTDEIKLVEEENWLFFKTAIPGSIDLDLHVFDYARQDTVRSFPSIAFNPNSFPYSASLDMLAFPKNRKDGYSEYVRLANIKTNDWVQIDALNSVEDMDLHNSGKLTIAGVGNSIYGDLEEYHELWIWDLSGKEEESPNSEASFFFDNKLIAPIFNQRQPKIEACRWSDAGNFVFLKHEASSGSQLCDVTLIDIRNGEKYLLTKAAELYNLDFEEKKFIHLNQAENCALMVHDLDLELETASYTLKYFQESTSITLPQRYSRNEDLLFGEKGEVLFFPESKRLWRRSTNKTDTLQSFHLSPDGRKVLFSEPSGQDSLLYFQLYDLDQDKVIGSLPVSTTGGILQPEVLFSTNSQRLILSDDHFGDRQLMVWDLEENRIDTFPHLLDQDGFVFSIQTNQDGSMVSFVKEKNESFRISTGIIEEAEIILWEVESDKVLSKKVSNYLDHRLHPDRPILFYSSQNEQEDKTEEGWYRFSQVRTWDFIRDRERTFPRNISGLNEMLFAGNYALLYAFEKDSPFPQYSLWHLDKGSTRFLPGSSNGIKISPDGQKLIFIKTPNKVAVWDLNNNQLIRDIEHAGSIDEYKFTSDSRFVYSNSEEGLGQPKFHKITFIDFAPGIDPLLQFRRRAKPLSKEEKKRYGIF